MGKYALEKKKNQTSKMPREFYPPELEHIITPSCLTVTSFLLSCLRNNYTYILNVAGKIGDKGEDVIQ